MAIWMYHPDKGARMFDSINDVPDGWADSPDFENANWTGVEEPEPEKEPVPKKKVIKKKGK